MVNGQIRQLHLYQEGDVSPLFGPPMTPCTISRCWEECVESSNYKERVKHVAEFNSNNRWKKRGIALTATKHFIGFHYPAMNQGAALVLVYLDGSVSLNHGGTELGQGKEKIKFI